MRERRPERSAAPRDVRVPGAQHAVPRAAPCGGCPTRRVRKRSGSQRETGMPADHTACREHPPPHFLPWAAAAVDAGRWDATRWCLRATFKPGCLPGPPLILFRHTNLFIVSFLLRLAHSLFPTAEQLVPSQTPGVRTVRQTTLHAGPAQWG